MAINMTDPPTLPDLGDPATFNSRALALLTWMRDTFIPELEAIDSNDLGGALQTQGDVLDDLNALGVVTGDGYFLVGTGSGSFAWENGATVRASLGLGASSNVSFASVATSKNGVSASFNRESSDGNIIDLLKDDVSLGAIGNNASSTGLTFYGAVGSGVALVSAGLVAAAGDGSFADNSKDLGTSSVRWNDVYATNGTIQTSDRNEKQDIAGLDAAEKRVAAAAKGLIRKYRWKSAVEKKGDDARIHFGIIAQDLQAAFEAEGLDAGRYGMFISTTWWETDEVIPAVEAQDAVYETQVDENGNEVQVLVSEAVEAQPERTVTHTYDTQEEAPEGAVERTRMGVRYPELLAFIIGAL